MADKARTCCIDTRKSTWECAMHRGQWSGMWKGSSRNNANRSKELRDAKESGVLLDIKRMDKAKALDAIPTMRTTLKTNRAHSAFDTAYSSLCLHSYNSCNESKRLMIMHGIMRLYKLCNNFVKNCPREGLDGLYSAVYNYRKKYRLCSWIERA